MLDMRSKIVDFLHSKFGQNLLRPTIEIRGNYSCIKSHVKKRKGEKRRIQENAENFCKTMMSELSFFGNLKPLSSV